MMVLFTSRSEKKALLTVRRILDQFADRIGNDTWQTIMTQEGVQEVKTLLRRSATKSTLDSLAQSQPAPLGGGKSRQIQRRRHGARQHNEKEHPA